MSLLAILLTSPRRILVCLSFILALLIWDTATTSAHDAPNGTLVSGSSHAASDGSCESYGLVSVPGLSLCTHGDDPSTTGTSTTSSPAPVIGSASSPVCVGDGSSGKRIQVIYARASNVTNRFQEYKASFQTWSAEASGLFAASAQQTGGTRYLRYIHDGNCSITITEVTLTKTGDDSFGSLISELDAKGFNRSDRKYLIFLDQSFSGVCGQGTLWLDDSPGASNYNNTQTGYAAIYSGCWGAPAAITHELSHTLGAVQNSAPNSTGSGHCTDEWDVMCYSDRSGLNTSVACANSAGELRLDCNNDDYFNTSPTAGSYLATHWNVARSEWLGGSSLSIQLSRESSKYNGLVDATLSGFSPGRRIYLTWDGDSLTSVVADATGSAVVWFPTPLDTFGSHTVSARDGNGLRVETTMRVIPRILLSTTSGTDNTSLRVYFYGFAAGEKVDVLWTSDNSVLKTVTIAENGRGTALVRIPKGAKVGSYSIRGKVQGVSRSASMSFSVKGISGSADPTPSPTASPTETPKPGASPEPTETPSVTPSPTETPAPIETPTVTPEPDPTESIPPTEQPTDVPIEIPTIEPTIEWTPEPTPEPTESALTEIAFALTAVRSPIRLG